jgi:hypothetical protein
MKFEDLKPIEKLEFLGKGLIGFYDSSVLKGCYNFKRLEDRFKSFVVFKKHVKWEEIETFKPKILENFRLPDRDELRCVYTAYARSKIKIPHDKTDSMTFWCDSSKDIEYPDTCFICFLNGVGGFLNKYERTCYCIFVEI